MNNKGNNMNVFNLKKLVYLFMIIGFVYMSCDTRIPVNTEESNASDISYFDAWVYSGFIILDGVNAVPNDTIYAQILDENGSPINNININFSMTNSDGIGSLSAGNVMTDSTGIAMTIYSIEHGEIPIDIDTVITQINITIPSSNEIESKTITIQFEISENWRYPELNVSELVFYPNDEVYIHYSDCEQEYYIMAKNEDGVGICNVPIFLRLENSNSNISVALGEINKPVITTCIDIPEIEGEGGAEENPCEGEDTGNDCLQHCDALETELLFEIPEVGIAELKYSNVDPHEDGGFDLLIATLKHPTTGDIIVSDSVRMNSYDYATQYILPQVSSFEIGQETIEININNNEETYQDSIWARAKNSDGAIIGGVKFNFSLEEEDFSLGSIANSEVISDSIGLAINVFETQTNIFYDYQSPNQNVSITISIPGREDLGKDTITLDLINNLPICDDCEAQLSLTTNPNTLPYGNPAIEQSIIIAFMVDSLGNPPEEGTVIEFESLTEDEEGEWIDFGYIEPYAYFDVNGEASVTFNMGNDAGLASIIGTSNGLSDTAYIVVNSTNASYIEIIPSYPSEITVTGGGGQEATEAAVEIKDGNGNLVTAPYKLFFQIEVPMPEGVHLNGIQGVTQTIQSSTVGQSAVTINAGTRPGSVKIHCTLFSDDVTEAEILAGTYTNDQLIATAEWDPVTIATGAPEFGEINFSPVDITPINGGMYELPISISLWDIHSNPVSDSTGVYVWIEENAPPWDDTAEYFAVNPDTGEPDIIKWGTTEFDSLAYKCLQDHNNANGIIIPTNEEYWERMQQPGFADGTTKTGGLNASGDAYPGIAWSNIYYSSATTFDRIVIKAQTFTNGIDNNVNQYLIIDSRDNHDGEATILPFQPGQIIVSASIQFWDFNPGVNGDTGGFTAPITIQAMITDYYGYPIDNGNLQLNAPGASFNGFLGADPEFENPSLSNAQGIVQWTIAYNKALCVAETSTPPITYADFISSISVQLLDPQQISSDPLDITLANSSIDE